MSSIDRKILRCQREIEAAKPKGMDFDEFRLLPHDITCVPYRGSQAVHVLEKDCRQIKGAAGAPGSATTQSRNGSVQLGAAPPPPYRELREKQTARKAGEFRVGDRVRKIASAPKGGFLVPGASGVVTDIDAEGDVWVMPDGSNLQLRGSCNSARFLELIPTPDAEAGDGWVTWTGGECPIPHAKEGGWAYRNRAGVERVAQIDAKGCRRWNHETPTDVDFVAYKVLA